MKKLPLMLLTVATSACITLSFTACCGGGSGTTLSSNNSNLVSDQLSSLEEWEAVFNGSDYNNFTASISYDYAYSYTYGWTEDDGTFTGGVNTSSNSLSAEVKYDFLKDTYLTGNYENNYSYKNSTYVNRYDFIYGVNTVEEDSTTEGTTACYDMWSDSYIRYATKLEDEWEWFAANSTDRGFFNYDYDCYGGSLFHGFWISTDMELYSNGVYLDGSANELKISSVNDLITAEYTDFDATSKYGEDTTTAEYKDGSYVFKATVSNDDLLYEIGYNATVTTYEDYYNFYVKVNDGHISYIKVDYIYNLTYNIDNTSFEYIITSSTEYSFYDFSSTTVTVPDEVTALFE